MDTQTDGWETQEQVDACLSDLGRSRSSAALWRRREILPRVEIEARGRGSIIHHPPGTCAQITAIVRLLKEKRDFEFVGRRLWWEGYAVADRYWLPQLTHMAEWLDRILVLLRPVISRYNRNETGPTLGDRLACADISNIALSRIERRLPTDQMAQLFGTFLDIASGQAIGVEIPQTPPSAITSDDDARRKRDADIVVRAFDMNGADIHSVLGQKFTFRKALPGTLATMTQAFATGSFAELLIDRKAIFAARDDVRNAFAMGADIYEALNDIYGDSAFGLRLVAWIAEKKPELMIATVILGMARLRRVPNDMYSSAEIAKMAKDAGKILSDAKAIRKLRQDNPALSNILDPKRIRKALVDQSSNALWRKEVAAAMS